jgi:small subunit ribosomal protein S9
MPARRKKDTTGAPEAAAEEGAPAGEESSTDAAQPAEGSVIEEAAAEETPPAETVADEPHAEEAGAEEAPAEPPAETAAGQPQAEGPAEEHAAEPTDETAEPQEPAERAVETVERDTSEAKAPPAAGDGAPPAEAGEAPPAERPAAPAPVQLAAEARYSATGKRKSAVARVILRPGNGAFELNGSSLESYFPRASLQAVVREPLTVAGYLDTVDVRAKIHGGGVSSQADALKHGIAKALIEVDPGLRGELKRRQLLTRDPRVTERRKAGLKKARKRPQFSKR